MKKVLILVMSSEKSYYKDLMECSRDTWASEKVEGVDIAFYCGEDKDSDKWTERKYSDESSIVRFAISDTLLNVAKKTKLALSWSKLKDYDYIFRANSSTYIDKKVLLNYVQDKPTTYFAGLPAPTDLYPEITHFMWGVQYIISRDLVELSVKREWNFTQMDDIALSLVLHDQEFQKGRMLTIHKKENGYDYLVYDEGNGGGGFAKDLSELPQGHYAYRCKQDFNRKLDCEIMRELWKLKQ